MASKKPGIPRPDQNFDGRAFLASAGIGRRSVKYKARSTIFAQGDSADAVFYIEKGSVQITVVCCLGGAMRRIRLFP
jgi:CRP-like cAMP-binding protein